MARESYDVIVVDTSPFFHGPMLATLDRTDELLLVCGLDDHAQERQARAPDPRAPRLPAEPHRVVLNQANSKVGMKRGEVEGALEVKVRFEVLSDRAVPIAVNRGNPAVLAESGADFSKAIREMAKVSAGRGREEPEARALQAGSSRWASTIASQDRHER